MIDVIKSSFEQYLKFFSFSAFGELASDEENASDDVSFFWTSCLQNFLSLELLLFGTSSFLLLTPLLSFVLPEPMLK